MKIKATKEQLVNLIKEMVNKAEDLDICDEGKQIIGKARNMVGMPPSLTKACNLIIKMYEGTPVDINDIDKFDFKLFYDGKQISDEHICVYDIFEC